ncbi:MAG: hypothetical protein ACLTW9_02720 [Enterocloster sp.]
MDTIAAIDPLHMAETYDDISKRSIEVMDTIVKATQRQAAEMPWQFPAAMRLPLF